MTRATDDLEDTGVGRGGGGHERAEGASSRQSVGGDARVEAERAAARLTARFQQVLDHYRLGSSRIRPGKPHENGVAEQSHFRAKTAIEQALLLRGERETATASWCICASCERSSTRSGMRRQRLGWPRSGCSVRPRAVLWDRNCRTW